MSYSRTRVLPTLLAAVLLIGAVNLGAYAASGKPLLLGKTNKATKTTTVKMKGNGAALSLKTKANSAPLKINSKVKVGNLNADRLDGLDSSALETLTYTFPLSGTTL
ncbi:hypothetical protein, partial [Nocardioides sp.]|uniref:hypothetical protein n=1 Tax=Nocardioides sp. TaxID=35761 RepID=UPI003562E898